MYVLVGNVSLVRNILQDLYSASTLTSEEILKDTMKHFYESLGVVGESYVAALAGTEEEAVKHMGLIL